MTDDFKLKTQCCGCGACENICPENCIAMRNDREGFLYPSVDEEKCIKCGLCKAVCPILNPVREEPFQQEAYFIQNKNLDILKDSTSGGFFTALAEYVISQGGIVYGAAMDEKLQTKHIGICNADQLELFRKSKYVQSSTASTYREARHELDRGRMVCYSGTPCQIEGLKKYLRKDYENLITCDIVCRSVPSPLILSKYIAYIEDRRKTKVASLIFRDKSVYGYKYNVITALDNKNRKIYQCGVESDPYLRAFFTNVSVRPSCYKCSFKKQYRVSDFTMWDAFNVGRFSRELDNDLGVTRILVHTSKGREIFGQIQDNFRIFQTTPEDITDKVKEMNESITYNLKRNEFFTDAENLTGTELFQKYFPDTIRIKAERMGRQICYRLGIYSLVKKVFVKVLRKY
ncbi:MAG: Coenzyme F420 hydrogenase/dehydrogenase, beta subunit C-terminal domain [Clostridium sp.]|nr:Coenzyme F420 hydrogenase/dehydrogenase, beta subunit C-terminal domain [Clostridium sp.]